MDPAVTKEINRTAKFFVDRDGVRSEEAEESLRQKQVRIVCGPEIKESRSLQAALLTAVNAGHRCFPDGIEVSLPGGPSPLLVPWTATAALADAVEALGGRLVPTPRSSTLALGTCSGTEADLQVTFDAWVGAVAPKCASRRLQEREGCVLSGVLAGGLGIAEVFLEFAGVTPEATRREVGFSLWRPDLPFGAAEAAGPSVEYLPGEWWSLGLGHLGQGILWSLGLLPFADPGGVNVVLNDHDRVVQPNVGTGLLTHHEDIGTLKTRVAARWLDARGFRPRLVERQFDEHVRIQATDPALGLGGFDGGGPRWALSETGFAVILDCGVGGRYHNFDAFHLHTLTGSGKSSREIWPRTLSPKDDKEWLERLVDRTPEYSEIRRRVGCGHLELAGRSVAAPFVGAIVGAFTVCSILRALNRGHTYELVAVPLSAPGAAICRPGSGPMGPATRLAVCSAR